MRRVLITGGSGFIGTNLVEHYAPDPETEVLNYDWHPPRSPGQRDRWAEGGILDQKRLLSVMEQFAPTELVHLAATTEQDGRSMNDYRANTDGVRVVLAASVLYGGIRRSVFASSRLVCKLGQLPVCDYDYFPPNFYGRSKVIAEQLIRAHDHAGEWVIVRPTSIWGPWGEAPYRDFFLSVARGRYVHPGRERVLKHYGYVGNTVYQIDRILSTPSAQAHGRTFYLADPVPTEVGAFAAAIRRTLGLKPPRSAPPAVLQIAAATADGLRTLRLLDVPVSSERLRNLRSAMLFDLREVDELVGPLPFTLEDGVARTVEHLRSQGDIPGRLSR